ncbi:MAG: hypothetical protein Q8K78_12590 [Planctomycetaceae bacterium]|nr:hypothetical protein [Planctomycetaceae bacterium]
MNRKSLWTGLIACVAWTAAQSAAWACPLCKVAIENDDRQPQAYMISILFMLGMIMSIAFGVGVLTWWINRNERRALEAAGYHHLFENGVNQAPEAAQQPS